MKFLMGSSTIMTVVVVGRVLMRREEGRREGREGG